MRPALPSQARQGHQPTCPPATASRIPDSLLADGEDAFLSKEREKSTAGGQQGDGTVRCTPRPGAWVSEEGSPARPPSSQPSALLL